MVAFGWDHRHQTGNQSPCPWLKLQTHEPANIRVGEFSGDVPRCSVVIHPSFFLRPVGGSYSGFFLKPPWGGGPGGAQAPRHFGTPGGGVPPRAGTFRIFPQWLYQTGPKFLGCAGHLRGFPKLKRSLFLLRAGTNRVFPQCFTKEVQKNFLLHRKLAIL
jgi:hypothetical protein